MKGESMLQVSHQPGSGTRKLLLVFAAALFVLLTMLFLGGVTKPAFAQPPDNKEKGHKDLSGVVTAVGIDQFTLDNSTPVSVTTGISGTVFTKAGSPAAFTDLKVGDKVEVKGTKDSLGAITALKVYIKFFKPKKIELQGIITALGADNLSFTLNNNITVTVTLSTTYTRDHAPIAFSDLKVGDKVGVKGIKDNLGVITATSVDLKNKIYRKF